MRDRVSRLFVVICLWLVGASSSAGRMSAEEAHFDGRSLLRQCQAALTLWAPHGGVISVPQLDMGRCLGYVDAIKDANEVFEAAYKVHLFCPPESVTTQQLVSAVYDFLKSHKDALSNKESVLTIAAFQQAFPCSEPSAPTKTP